MPSTPGSSPSSALVIAVALRGAADAAEHRARAGRVADGLAGRDFPPAPSAGMPA
jgi:hypothetical protein